MARRHTSNLINALLADARDAQAKAKTGDTWHLKAGHLRTRLYAMQARLEADRSKRKSVRSPRQTGKSTGVMLITVIRCLEKAGAEWIVVGLTRPSIKRIYWGELKALNKFYELGLTFNNQELIARFANGSSISFVGADNIGEIEKLRGGRYDGVVVDECKSFDPGVFEALIHEVLEAALMAKDGELTIIGTPGDVLEGPFYLATCSPAVLLEMPDGSKRYSNRPLGAETDHPAMWSLHEWTLRDNVTRFRRQDGSEYTMFDQALAIKATNGWADDHPYWLREFEGKWVADTSLTVFRYRTYVHDYVPAQDTQWGLPEECSKHVWHRVLGVDLGTRDGTAFVVWAFSPTYPGLWELYSDKRTREPGERFPVSEVAAWYAEVEAEYGPFIGGAVDTAGLGTMILDTLAVDHGMTVLEAAEKKEKVDHVELFNNDLDARLIHVRRDSALSRELRTARWAEKPWVGRAKREEDPKVPNDVTDAAVYAFRWCRHRQAKAKVEAPALFTNEWWQAEAARQLESAKAEARARHDLAGALDAPWWKN
jgi:hypothetical protein